MAPMFMKQANTCRSTSRPATCALPLAAPTSARSSSGRRRH